MQAIEREPMEPEKLDSRSFFGVLLFGAMCAAVAFFWTVSLYEPEPRAEGSKGPPPPRWQTPPRTLMAQARYEELAADARALRREGSRDPEAWMYGAFAHEALAAEPGLDAVEHRAMARALWEELLEASRRAIDNPDRLSRPYNTLYYEGWALQRLGRPVIARERFGAFAARQLGRLGVLSDFNLACYLALAGDHAGALDAWHNEMVGSPSTGMKWAVTDPDLDAIRDDLWALDLRYHGWRRVVELEWAERRARARSPGDTSFYPPRPGRDAERTRERRGPRGERR